MVTKKAAGRPANATEVLAHFPYLHDRTVATAVEKEWVIVEGGGVAVENFSEMMIEDDQNWIDEVIAP